MPQKENHRARATKLQHRTDFFIQVSLHKVMTFKILIQDGIKLCCLQVNHQNNVLDSLYKMRIRGSAQLQTVSAMYQQKIDQNRSMPSYQWLMSRVRRHIGQTIRTRNFSVSNERIETGVLVKCQKGKNVCVERRMG